MTNDSSVPVVNDDDWTLDGSDLGEDMPTAVEVAFTGIAAAEAPSPEPAKAPAARTTKSRSRHSKTLYFDLETIPDASRIELFGLPPIAEAAPRAELPACPPCDEVLAKPLKEIEKLLADLRPPDDWLNLLRTAEEGRSKRKGMFELIDNCLCEGDKIAALHADRQKLLSTTPEFCSICALGYAVGDDDPVSIVVGQDGATESDLLDCFWKLVAECKPIVGFNIAGFDLPVIFVRSIILGVPASRTIDMKPWGGDMIDVYLARFGPRGNSGSGRPGKMKDLGRLFGVPVPAGDVDGSQVAELYASDPEQVGVYVESDVAVVRGLHRKFTGMFC